jgi:hypothetical protein
MRNGFSVPREFVNLVTSPPALANLWAVPKARRDSGGRFGWCGLAPLACRLAWVVVCWLAFTGIDVQAGPLITTDSPIGFFTNVAARLLQSQLGLSLNHIQVYPTNQYTPSVHRLLQVTANLYDATTNRTVTGYPYLPSVFRPVFAIGPPQAGSQVYICGFEEVTNTDVLSRPVVELTDPNARANLSPHDMVSGIPLVIGVKKGFPNFNAFASYAQVQVARKLQFHRPGASTTANANEIDQMFVMGISNVLGVEAWNSYSAPFSRDLQMVAEPDLAVLITNLETGRWLNPTNSRFRPPATAATVGSNTWTGFELAIPQFSFQMPVFTNCVFLTNSTYQAAGDQFVPLTATFERNPGTTNFHVPHWQFTLKVRLRFALVDTGRIVDYVNLNADNQLDITTALTAGGVCGIPYTPDGSNGSMWCTNRMNGAIGDYIPTYGIQNQIEASLGHTAPNWNSSLHEFPPGMSVSQAVDFFKGQFQPGYLLSSNTFNAPYQPFRNIYLLTSWQANDPLVHYTFSDLTDLVHTSFVVDQFSSLSPDPTANLGHVNDRYEPWGGNPTGSSISPTKLDLTVKDPFVLGSDYWDFPTNLLSDLTLLGRVHRGTPWQTIYLKSSGTTFNNWIQWTGNNLLAPNWNAAYGGTPDAFYTQPTNDWRLASLVLSLLNTNDPRNLASVNQPNPPAWSSLLDGMTVLTNSASGQFDPVIVSSNSPQAAIVAAALDAARASQPGQRFHDLGEILATPELSLASPWLDTNGVAALLSTVNDEACEALPSQLLHLLRPDSTSSATQSGGTLQVQFTGSDGFAYAVQISSNLADWIAVSTNYPANGSFNFLDTPASGSSRRFYRSILQP